MKVPQRKCRKENSTSIAFDTAIATTSSRPEIIIVVTWTAIAVQ
jgi:hypothetical protein